MKLKEAFSRLGFTISKQNKPNQLDADALNVILENYKKSEEKIIQENLLFAKLYAYFLGKLSSHYNDVDEANKHINKILQNKMSFITGILEMELRAMEVRQVIKDDILTDLKPTDINKKIEQYPNLEKEFLACWDFWDHDNVISHLNTNINLSIQNFKNHD